MTIKEVEEKTGLCRSNIRFYEKEKLVVPFRNKNNGYREYTEEDIESIKKIAFLRTLDISVEKIRKIMRNEIELHEIISNQYHKLDTQIEELQLAKAYCNRMLQKGNLNINNLEVEQYTDNVDIYWNENHKVLKMDTVSYIYMWGGSIIWGLITAFCLIIAILAYPILPEYIPIQWSEGIAISLVAKELIFAYPLSCIIIRFILRPFIWRWLKINAYYSESITNYIVNFLCFVALSVEVFTILFISEIVKHITVILFMDVAVFLGLLIIGLGKLDTKNRI